MKCIGPLLVVTLVLTLALSSAHSQITDHRVMVPELPALRPPPLVGLQSVPDSVHPRPILRKTGTTNARPFVIDTALVYAFADTTRYIYRFNSNATMVSQVSQKLTAGAWVDMLRYDYTYDDRARLTGQIMARRLNGHMTPVNRNTCTYDIRGYPATDLNEVWDDITGSWQVWYKASFLVDPHGLTLLEQVEYLSGGKIRGGSRATFDRDEKGNELLRFLETWENGWVPYVRLTTTRDDHARPVSVVREERVDGQWVNIGKTDQTYDDRGNPLTEAWNDWVDGQWQPTSRLTQEYDAQNDPTLWLYESASHGRFTSGTRFLRSFEDGRERTNVFEEWSDNAWVIRYRVTFDYNAIGDRIMSTRFEPDHEQWSVFEQTSYTYDAARRLTGVVTETWQNGRRYGTGRRILQYNAGGDETLNQEESIDSLGRMSSGRRTISTYDPGGLPVGFAYETWQNGAWQPEDLWWSLSDSATITAPIPFRSSPLNQYFFSGYRVELRSSAIETVPPQPASIALRQNYPNPFNAGTMITYALSKATAVRLAIYDLLGREVARPVDGQQGPGTFTVSVSAAQLSSGVYFYVLTAGASVEARKMIVLK